MLLVCSVKILTLGQGPIRLERTGLYDALLFQTVSSWAEREEMPYHLNMEMMAHIFRQSLLDGIYSAAVEPERATAPFSPLHSWSFTVWGRSKCQFQKVTKMAGQSIPMPLRVVREVSEAFQPSDKQFCWSILQHSSCLTMAPDHTSEHFTANILVYLLVFSPYMVRTGMGNVA